jgi:hypothetical protein
MTDYDLRKDAEELGEALALTRDSTEALIRQYHLQFPWKKEMDWCLECGLEFPLGRLCPRCDGDNV